ncbi:adenosylcobalamin-dependent ribonucleoside-diphosphate reductase [Nordella sp. HKS 07]|uniref:adenosylcobalamin-dependent ribonucleoside-diphosphate reductase n=1 Tax=Nordella sp. HKS 07 TaxID=2712222 RepID=UPI0013E1B7D7|nr:adenosylcobalamin-dependent ribonucleoside-diphosphate reductase [Nordella sp. HKS 07]QIG48167.1 adenosylcobalamin-dependent ribonucleoside-diphosphate reductase [Nordella sp. HKS 07]
MSVTERHDLDPISAEIWDMKYRFKRPDGAAVDATVEASWQRVAKAVAEAEKPAERARWAREFEGLLKDYRFLPAGRILSGAGTARTVTLFNCFVMGRIEDSLSGIFDALKEAALTMQQGGGVGMDFSTIRPKGAAVKGVGADASGPLSFMDVWDAMCRTIMSAGSRRGAMMGTLRCDHPDIEDFIAAKADPKRLRMFNLSVLVTDDFMKAVKADSDWPLVFAGQTYKTIRARPLWDQIMRSTYDYAEPGVIFIDRINALNNLSYCETIQATNPCGEQPLPPYGACLLGSINLAALVSDPFTEQARLDEAELARLVPLAVRFMDNVVDVSNYPLPEQRREALAKRRIGLGITGLADALAMCGLRYGSDEASARAKDWMAGIERHAYLASAALAAEKGAFPLYDAEAYLAGGHVKGLGPDIKAAIARTGIRNALLTSIAPTGTISLFAGNVSSGIEPIFSVAYERKVLQPNGERVTQKVVDYAARLWRGLKGADAPLPSSFVTVNDLEPHEHLVMQAAIQPHIDSSISKTINCPPDLSFEAFKAVYLEAYDRGLKGCTTFRPNEVTGAVLSLGEPAKAEPVQAALPLEAVRDPVLHAEPGEVVYMKQPLARHEVLPGFTYKLKWADSDHAIYITINDILQDGRRRPFEIFINSKNMEHFAWTVALTRMISAVFRRGGDVSFVVEELKAVFDPRGGQWMDGRYVPSLLAAIGGVIERHMIDTGFLKPDAKPGLALAVNDQQRGAQCPRCGEATLVFQEGCATCLSCGYSKCS